MNATANAAMNTTYSGTVGQTGQAGVAAPTQPMLRPGYAIPQQQPRPYAPPPAGYMPVPAQAPAPGQPTSTMMPPGGG